MCSRLGRRAVLIGLSGLVLAPPALAGLHGDLMRGLKKLGVGPDALLESAREVLRGIALDESDEIELGRKLYPKLMKISGGSYPNRAAQDAVAQVFAPIRAVSRRAAFDWKVTIVNDDAVNAWSLPGGHIAVNRGLLRYLETEDELAAVLAHEMGHVEHSHVLGEMRRERFMGGLSTLANEAIEKQTRRYGKAGLLTEAAIDQLADPMHELVNRGYSRGDEEEADEFILDAFERTGHSPERGVEFFRTLLELIPPGTKLTTSLFSTHPGTRARIEAILEEAQERRLGGGRRPSAAFARLKQVFPTRRYYKRNA